MKIRDCLDGYEHDWLNTTTMGEHARSLFSWTCLNCSLQVTIDEGPRIRAARAAEATKNGDAHRSRTKGGPEVGNYTGAGI